MQVQAKDKSDEMKIEGLRRRNTPPRGGRRIDPHSLQIIVRDMVAGHVGHQAAAHPGGSRGRAGRPGSAHGPTSATEWLRRLRRLSSARNGAVSGRQPAPVWPPLRASDNPLAKAPPPSYDPAAATQPDAGTPTLGAAATSGVDALGQWLAAQRAKSVKLGLMDPTSGWPTRAGIVDAAGQYCQRAPDGHHSARGGAAAWDRGVSRITL